jgi:outer membrane protein assembly factor BamB
LRYNPFGVGPADSLAYFCYVAGLLLSLALTNVMADNPRPDDWPVFRGNALQTGVASSQLPDKLDVLWTFKTKDAIEGSAAIARGTVYVGSQDEYLYALDLATGKEKWRYKAAPIKVTPSVHGDCVYVGDGDGWFHCVDAATGKARWKFEAGAEITSAPNFAGDTVLFGCGDENLYCLSADGKLVWKFKVAGGPVLGSPAIAGGRTFVSGCDSTMHVIDVAKGTELSSVALDGQTGSTTAVVGDNLYVGTMTNQVIAIDWKKAEVLWRFEVARRQKPFYASTAVTDAVVIAGSRDRHVYAIDRRTGKEIWSFATHGQVDSSPVIVGQRIFAGSLDGNCYVLDLATGRELKRFDLGGGEAVNKGITASPAVGEGFLVIGTNDGTVHCLGGK